ncbi:pseudouridine-5'-phosphate glycosidase [soil metagenome]
MKTPVELGAEISAALAAGKTVVAIESNIIAHGMAYPRNVETAKAVDDSVRRNGAIPATVAVIDGRVRAGLTPDEIEWLGREGAAIPKISTRDLPFAVAQKRHGATTVAATMRIAALAGIHVFATGGIGGVHRGAESTFDISADLTELSLSNVAVVTAGAKAILDLALTLERLESLGVPVVGYGTQRFPAFYSRDSGFDCPMRLDTPREVAALMHAKWNLGLKGGIVVANPIPLDSEIPSETIMPAIEAALAEAHTKGVNGKDVTPFLLARLADITAGRSLDANIALVLNNAAVAATIAIAYAEVT